MSAESLGNYVVIWEGWSVYLGVIDYYMITFIVVHEVVEVEIIPPFPLSGEESGYSGSLLGAPFMMYGG